MDSIRNHRDLIAWQKAMDLAVEVYRLAEKLPMREAYGIYSQTTRAAASVPANIAEGHGRQGAKEFANFLWTLNEQTDSRTKWGASPRHFDRACCAAPNAHRLSSVVQNWCRRWESNPHGF